MGGWPGEIGAVAGVTTAFYVSMLLMVRVAGRRTLAQLSAFDVVITIAIGSLLASTALGPPSGYLRGIVALGVLLVAQVTIGAMRQRWAWMRRLTDFPSEVIGRNGHLDLPRGIQRAQLTEDEVMSKLRQHGVFRVEEATLVLLEPDGRISVLRIADDDG